MTPHRIHPYAVAAPADAMKGPDTHFLPFYQLMLLRKFISREPHFMLAIARAYRYFHEELRLDAKQRVKQILKQRFEGNQPDWSIPLYYDSVEALKLQAQEKMAINAEALRLERLEESKQGVEKAQRKAFHQEHSQPNALKPKTKSKRDKEVEMIVDYSVDDITPEQEQEFEAELEEFIKDVEQELSFEPRPEKW